MLLAPLISPSGNTQWILRYLDHQNPDTNSAVEIRFCVYGVNEKRLAIPALAQMLEKADFDWVYVENCKVRVDASAGLDALAIKQSHIPWFKGLLEIEPIIERHEENMYVRAIIERQRIRSMTVSGGEFSLAPDTTNFRVLTSAIQRYFGSELSETMTNIAETIVMHHVLHPALFAAMRLITPCRIFR